jgi:hypothetical protein
LGHAGELEISLPGSNSESFRDSEFFVRGIGNLAGCILNRLFRITGELFTLAFRPLSEAFGLQLFRAGGFAGCFLDFSRGPQPPKGWNTPRSKPTSTHSNQLRPPSETLPQWLAVARSV